MFDLPSFRIGRILGIPLEINASWLLIFVLIASALSFTYFPQVYPGRPLAVDVVSGVVTALLFFASVVLHEVAHSIVARTGGAEIRKITLFVFGGVAQMEEEPRSPGREFVMAVAGPMTSLAIAVLCFTVFVALWATGLSDVWWAPFEYLAAINVAVAVFNLLPGFPLDGGRVLRAGLWKASGDLLKATRWAAMAGRGLGVLMMSGGFLGVLFRRFDLIWFVVLGWFLSAMATSAYRDQVIRMRMSHVTVGSHMTSPAVTVPGELTVQQLVNDYFIGGKHSQYPVVIGDEVVGLLHMSALKELPRDRWGTTRLVDVATRDVSDLVVLSSASVDTILPKLGPEGAGALLVVDEGRLAGIITRSDVIHALRTADAEVRAVS